MDEVTYTGYCHSPIGTFCITCHSKAVVEAYFTDNQGCDLPPDAPEVLKEAISQVSAYFAGCRKVFDVPLDPAGPPFFQQVWRELLRIPYGSTCSYGALAANIGHPKASRAVGLANNRNPISILIPCHRVIGANGNLTGYASGLERKRWLLALEKR